MMIFRDIPASLPEPCVAAIGFFDGVHLGHRFLIDQVKDTAREKGLRTAIITFPVHPRKVMNDLHNPELLTTYREKIELLEETGIDYCFFVDFTPDISRLSAEEFMRIVLRDRYNVCALVIGYDHRFGHNRTEGFDDYCRFGQALSIDVVRANACTINNIAVSSSVVRRLLQTGEVSLAAEYLGYTYFLNGTVVGGHQIGRTMGFPTANLSIDDPDKLIPADGVYAVRVEVEGKPYAGMLNIGRRPTINNGHHRSIEVHILNFHSDIYDFSIRVSFVERVRAEMKFSGKDELIRQLTEDAEIVKHLLNR